MNSVLVTRLANYAVLMRLHRPIGSLLLLWPTLWALWIAGNGHPAPKLVVIFGVGVVLMRSAGCVINDYFDRSLDGAVSRTCRRPLVTGQVSPRQALILFSLLCLLAASLLLALPPLARWLALPAVAITIIYPLMKRYTHVPQLVLGIAFGCAIPMVFAAQTGHLPFICWYLFSLACLWPVAYDTIYAMVDREDDRRAGIKSTAVLSGNHAIWVIAGLHLLLVIMLGILGWYLSLSWRYFLSVLIAAVIMSYQHYLIKERIPLRCFKAFLHSQWIGCVIFLGILLS